MHTNTWAGFRSEVKWPWTLSLWTENIRGPSVCCSPFILPIILHQTRATPLDPRARVTCQWTIFSQARALTFCQHLFCRKQSSKRSLIPWEARKPNVRNFSFSQRFNRLIKFFRSSALTSSEWRPHSQSRWYASPIVPVYAAGRSKQMPAWTPIEGCPQKKINNPGIRPRAINQGVVSGILECRCYRCWPVYTLTLQLPLSL